MSSKMICNEYPGSVLFSEDWMQMVVAAVPHRTSHCAARRTFLDEGRRHHDFMTWAGYPITQNADEAMRSGWVFLIKGDVVQPTPLVD